MDEAYDSDEVREEAESACLKEALAHWDEKVLLCLEHAAGKARVTKHN